MKKIAIGSAIAVALLLVLSACGGSDNTSDTSTNTTATDTFVTPAPEPAPAPMVSPEDQFLNRLNGLGDPVILSTSDADLLSIGQETCSVLDQGYTVTDLVTYLYDNGYITSENGTAVGQIVGAAVSTLCPQYTSQLQDFIDEVS